MSEGREREERQEPFELRLRMRPLTEHEKLRLARTAARWARNLFLIVVGYVALKTALFLAIVWLTG